MLTLVHEPLLLFQARESQTRRFRRDALRQVRQPLSQEHLLLRLQPTAGQDDCGPGRLPGRLRRKLWLREDWSRVSGDCAPLDAQVSPQFPKLVHKYSVFLRAHKNLIEKKMARDITIKKTQSH